MQIWEGITETDSASICFEHSETAGKSDDSFWVPNMDVPIGLFLAVLTKNLMMVTTLLLCKVVSLYFGHSEPAIKYNFGCTNQKSYDF
jgi:hypothetical protein